MEEHSGTRTGRWRRALRESSTLSFEERLLRAMREAQARGLSSTEASGMFKAALQRLGEMEEDKQRERNKEGDRDHDD